MPQLAEMRGDDPGGSNLFEPKLGMGVEIAAEGDERGEVDGRGMCHGFIDTPTRPALNRRHSIEPHEFWQGFRSAASASKPPYDDRFPARLPDGRVLFLPIRALGDTGTGIASLILNQCALNVENALADILAEQMEAQGPDIIVGLPTLGLSLARLVAERLDHKRYVALSTSRKFWYDEGLSVPMRSITSPDQEKRLYLDPRMLPVLEGADIGVVDDVISSGASMAAGLAVLRQAGFEPVSIGAAMLQTRRWVDTVTPPEIVTGVIETPLLRKTDAGWVPEA